MKRRTFLHAAMAMPMLGAAAAANDDLKSHRIVNITGFVHQCPRPKFVGKNARLDDHGDHTSDRVLRLTTNQGVVGFGSGHLNEGDARKILGQRVDQLWTDGVGSTGALGRADHALFDLVAKIRGVPAWKLIGTDGAEWTDIYDGSIYFSDLMPAYQSDGVGRLVRELEEGIERGFRAFKIKVGRGHKWMPKPEGFARDVAVVRALRKAAGPEIRLMVDANNGFTLDETLKWLDEVGDTNLYFVEEMFPEDVEQDRALKHHIREKGWKTLVADGESAGEIEHFEPFLRAKVLDVLQPDIRALGLSKQLAMSKRMSALDPDARLAPHNWGSYLGQFMQLVLARGIGNFSMAEVDTSASDLFDDSAFTRKDGKVRAPDIPGCGLAMREDVFLKKYRSDAWSVD